MDLVDFRIIERDRPNGVAGVGLSFPIVALAASAGGLDALRQLLRGIPADLGAAILIVQHMAPDQKTHLAEILGRHCALPVAVAEQGGPIGKGRVLIAPPDRHLLVGADGTVVLSSDPPVNFCRPSADRLFESAISRAAGPRTIAVVLTGTSRDGADGMRAVRRGGGTTIVQSEESSAHTGMPRAALATGPDLVVGLEAMARTLDGLVRGVG